MDKDVLLELKEIKSILAHLAGTIDVPEEQQFSKAALDKAAKLFVKLNITENQWVQTHDLSDYFKGCYRYELGKFLRDEFKFTNYYNKGNAFFYNKKDIINLAEELKKRNVDLARYMELCKSKDLIKNKITSIASKNRDTRVKANGKTKAYTISEDLKNIQLSDFEFPEFNVVEQDIAKFMAQFESMELGDHIDIYGDHALIKDNSYLKLYLPNRTYTICQEWCNKYNKAQHALFIIREHLSIQKNK
jgi:hypothetical protein